MHAAMREYARILGEVQGLERSRNTADACAAHCRLAEVVYELVRDYPDMCEATRSAIWARAEESMTRAEEIRAQYAAPTSGASSGVHSASSGVEGMAISSSIPVETWDDVIGLEKTKEAIQLSTRLAFSQARAFRDLGGQAQRFMLLYGPPGTGKTLIARAVANQLQCQFFLISPSDIFNKYVGESEQAIKRIFQTAIAACKALIFIDEIDGLAPSRQDAGVSDQLSKRLVTELIQRFDDVLRAPEVILMAATNLPASLDSAILRRFQVRLCVPLPTAAGRRAMFQADFPHIDRAEDLDRIVELTRDFNASDIANLIKQAKNNPMTEAVRATHFKPADDDGWTPCDEHDTGAVAMSAYELAENSLRPRKLRTDDILSALSTFTKTARMDEVKRIYEYADRERRDIE